MRSLYRRIRISKPAVRPDRILAMTAASGGPSGSSSAATGCSLSIMVSTQYKSRDSGKGDRRVRTGRVESAAEVRMAAWRRGIWVMVLVALGVPGPKIDAQGAAPVTAIRAGRLFDPEAGR